MNTQTHTRQAWRAHAKCADMPAYLFDAEHLRFAHYPDERAAAARALCSGCPVVAECAADALHPWGIGTVRAGILIPERAYQGEDRKRVRAQLAEIARGEHG